MRRLDDEPRRAHLNILLREISTALECVDESLQNLCAIEPTDPGGSQGNPIGVEVSSVETPSENHHPRTPSWEPRPSHWPPVSTTAAWKTPMKLAKAPPPLYSTTKNPPPNLSHGRRFMNAWSRASQGVQLPTHGLLIGGALSRRDASP